MREHRLGVVDLAGGVEPAVVRVRGEPRRTGGEAGVRLVRPLHRGAGVVPADLGQPGQRHALVDPELADAGVVVHRLEVAVVVGATERVVRHPELLALVDVRRPAHAVQHGGQRRRRGAPVLRVVVAEPRDHPRLVVVVPVQAVPAPLREGDLPAVQGLLEHHPVEPDVVELVERPVVDADVLELEHHVDLGARRVGVELRLLGGHARHLADGEVLPVAAVEHLPGHLREVAVDVRAVGELVEGQDVLLPRPFRHVGQPLDLRDEVDDVHPEAVDAAVEPPAHHRVDRLADLGVLPVQVRLLAVEQVQVVLAAGLVPRPRGTAEERPPVVGLGPVAWVAPEVPVALRAVGRRGRLDEPRVLVRGVVDHQVHDELDAPLVQAGDEGVELLERAEQRVDVVVVADVVAVVRLRRPVDRGEPHHVDAEGLEVVEVGADPGEVTDPVAVGVGEAARVDLVDDGGLPPVGGSLSHDASLCQTAAGERWPVQPTQPWARTASRAISTMSPKVCWRSSQEVCSPVRMWSETVQIASAFALCWAQSV